jgi:hypothetical protein
VPCLEGRVHVTTGAKGSANPTRPVPRFVFAIEKVQVEGLGTVGSQNQCKSGNSKG